MREVKQLILRYAPSDSPVLILGESGTGKELVAKAIHEASRRRGGPCVAMNCGALPETLLETELFGAEKGAFTDAVWRPGSFERANGGTLFLDEIGEMSFSAQARLLRVIEQKELTRARRKRPVTLDVRVVSATTGSSKGGGGAARSAPTSSTVSAFCPSVCPRCGSEARTSRSWPRTSCADGKDEPRGSERRRVNGSARTRGRATSASFAT